MNVAEDQLDATFTALADPTRRAIVARLARGDATVNELAAPFDMTLPGISKHLKVLETVMVSDADGSQYTMRAEYVEIVAPERIVWTESGSGMTTISTFSDLGNARTEVQIRQANVPEAARSPEARAGFATSLDRFAAYLGELVRLGPDLTKSPNS